MTDRIAPDACTLPTAEQPLRAAEFQDLFAEAVRATERIAPTRLRLRLLPDPKVAASAADLAVRETGCCGFFTFTLTATGGELSLDVAVPPTQVSVLDAVAELADHRDRRAGQPAEAI